MTDAFWVLCHTAKSSMSIDSENIPALRWVALHLVAFQEKLVEHRLHPGGQQKTNRVAWPVYVMHAHWGWKVVLSVIEMSVLFMHIVSTYDTQLPPEKKKWLVLRLTLVLADLPEQGAPGTASLPKSPYSFLIIPVSVIFLINLSNVNIRRKYVKPFIKVNSKHTSSASNFTSSSLQMRNHFIICLFWLYLQSIFSDSKNAIWQ